MAVTQPINPLQQAQQNQQQQSSLGGLSAGLAQQPNKAVGLAPSDGSPTIGVGGAIGANASAAAPLTQWTGAMNLPAMIQAATQERGGAMQDPSVNYWAGVAPQFEQRYGSGAANELYQRMMGKEASGSAAAPAGIYSAANGYNYIPQQDPAQMAAIPGLQGLNFSQLGAGQTQPQPQLGTVNNSNLSALIQSLLSGAKPNV